MPENPEENFEFVELLSDRMRSKGISLKRLAETTGIAPTHIESMLRGDFENLPSAPYFHGYLLRVAKVLDFDGEEWWKKMKNGNAARKSGPADVLPRNRFIKKEAPKSLWIGGVALFIIVIYLAIALPRIIGKPSLTLSYPPQDQWVSTSTSITLAGIVSDADTLWLLGGNSSSSEEILIAQDGSWQKTVFLGRGLNTFRISAKKFLGRETTVTEQIFYSDGLPLTNASSTTTSTFPTIHFSPEIPATGTYYE